MTDELVQIQGFNKLLESWETLGFDVNDTDSFIDEMYTNLTDGFNKTFAGEVDEEV